MVCVLEGEKAVCVVRDFVQGTTDQKVMTLTLAASTTVQELFQEVGRRYHYDPDTFEVILQLTDGDSIVLNECKDRTIEDVGVSFESGVRNKLVLSSLRRKPVISTAVVVDGGGEDDMLLGASASPTASGDYSSSHPPPPPAIMSADYTYTAALIKHDTGYVGLVNQAMTCYLNSLLQALYMTPEFRNALYKWEFDGEASDEVKSIPYQLQKLFLNLQTSSKSAVETTDLTRSFGWDSSEAWQQHDIQELCRVMFDALEQKFNNTEQADLILRLYEGKMIDYVKCLECSTEKTREDTFLDIPLPVRPFGSTVAYGSIEEALRAFVQPETLDGNNQYHCDKCNKKCDAHKGLKFSKFPYLLTLHLKRFDFDYNTLHRIKLNDKVVFPEALNLNSFVGGSTQQEEGAVEESVPKSDASSTTDSGSALDDETCDRHAETSLGASHDAEYQEDDEGIDVSASASQHENEKNRLGTADKGPYLYDLFSIMIHSGSASGGHYYAYIKDFSKGEWFCFNDQSVTTITYDDIKKTYGGGPMRSYYSGAYSSSTNAYMLMYRQMDTQRNCEAMTEEEFLPHIKALLKRVREREETDRVMREKEMDKCKLKLYVHHPTQNQVVDTKLFCHNNVTLKDATSIAHMTLKLEGVVPLERCRLVHYDRIQGSIECSFEGRDEETIGDILNSLRSTKYDLLLEIRNEDAEFEVYQPGGVVMKVFVVDVTTEDVEGPIVVRGNLSQTVGEFKQTLERALGIRAEAIKIVVEKYSNPHPLDCDDKTLKAEGFYSFNKIFVSSMCDEDPEKPFMNSKLHRIIDRYEHLIPLHMVLPDIDKETLQKLSIPPLTVDANQDSLEHQPKEVVAGGDLSPPQEPPSSSPQPPIDTEDEALGATGQSDQSASEDSSLTDSDRTLVGDVPDDCLAHLSSHSNSPTGSDQQNISSPEEGTTHTYHSFAKEEPENWDNEENDTAEATTRSTNYFFKAAPYLDNDNQRMLKLLVDKRMILSTLKKDLEPYVGVPQEYFKIYRLYPGQQEYECVRLQDSLNLYREEERLMVKLGRALRKGEHRGKVYQLVPNCTEPCKFLCDWILGKGERVGDVKREILEEIKRKYSINIPYENCRLRKKSWKNPAKVYLDAQQFEDDISLLPNWEMFVQELPEPETVSNTNQMVLFTRCWCPSTLELKPFQEIVLDGVTTEELRTKVSGLSGIPEEALEFAKGHGSFPYDMSVLSIHSDIEWNGQSTTQDNWPLNIVNDGHVILYRNSKEEVKQLTSEERKEIVNKEGSRVSKLCSTVLTYSPRKERALKIYLDTSPRKKDELDLD